MRKRVLLSMGIILLAGCARLQVVPDGQRVIRGVYPVAMDKSRIYNNTLEWMAKKLSGAGEDIVVKDMVKGRIMGRGMNYYYEYFSVFVKRPFTFVMTVDVKENKFRITYDSFNVYYDENVPAQSAMKFRSEFDNIRKKLDNYTEDLKSFLNNRLKENGDRDDGTNVKEEEW